MTTKVSIWRALRSTTREHWREAITLTAFALVGGLAPLWIGWLIVRSTTGNPQLIAFARNGEFALYSASLLAPAFYIVVHERSETPFAGRASFVLLALIGILVAVACYTMVAPETSSVIPFVRLDRDFIGHATITLFALSLAFSLIVTTMDNARTSPPIREMIHKQQVDLDHNFDELSQ